MINQEKYLITTESWFYAPDGTKYRAVWGTVQLIEDGSLGIKTNRNSSNWFAQVGSKEKHIMIAGCEIHYAVRCSKPPWDGLVTEVIYDAANGSKEITRPTEIYVAE